VYQSSDRQRIGLPRVAKRQQFEPWRRCSRARRRRLRAARRDVPIRRRQGEQDHGCHDEGEARHHRDTMPPWRFVFGFGKQVRRHHDRRVAQRKFKRRRPRVGALTSGHS
jgi:hypothetical protein